MNIPKPNIITRDIRVGDLFEAIEKIAKNSKCWGAHSLECFKLSERMPLKSIADEITNDFRSIYTSFIENFAISST